MFWRLGLLNSVRQVGRSLLILVAMVLAAVSLTSAFALSQGQMQGSYQTYRDLLGGDILVAPLRWSGQQPTDVTGDQPLFHQRLRKTGLSWLEQYYPELYEDGFFSASAEPPRQSFTAGELEQLAQQPELTEVGVHPQLPADLTNLSLGEPHYLPFIVLPLPETVQFNIREGGHEQNGMPLDLTEYRASQQSLGLINCWQFIPDRQIAERALLLDANLLGTEESPPGTLTPDELTRMSRWIAYNMLSNEMHIPRDGESARLLLPTLQVNPDGECQPDYTHVVQQDLPIAAKVERATRKLYWTKPGAGVTSETACLHGPYLWVPEATWTAIWQQVAGDMQPPPYNVTLRVQDLSRVSQTVQQLQQRFPEFTFIDVQSFADRMNNLSRLDKFYFAPWYVYAPAKTASLGMPLRLRPLLGLALFLIAGMLLASRMLTGSAARRHEIGILKSLGARRRDILAMSMGEALALSLLGSLVGFLCARLGAVALELSNQVPWSQILLHTAREGGLVIGAASLIALIFALLPAMRLANITAMGVLRGE